MDKRSLWKSLPLDGALGRITARFGGNNPDLWPWWGGLHNGLDFGAACGEPVMAVRDGRVFEVRTDRDGYGQYLKIGTATDHELYAHLSGYAVGEGDVVKAGDVIGFVGRTGNSTGCHLHLGKRAPSVRRSGNFLDGWINPLPFLWQFVIRQRGFVLSDHWDAHHQQAYDEAILRRWSPPVVKLLERSYMNPGALGAALDVVAGGSVLLLRNWAISEGSRERMWRDPEGLGRDNANWWAAELKRIEEKTGLRLPRERLLVEGVNEPEEWHYGTGDAELKGAAMIARYASSFIETAATHALVGSVPALSRGWPGNEEVPEKRPHWEAYEAMRVPLIQFGGVLNLHEYALADDGVVDMDEGWQIGRYRTSYDAPGWEPLFKIISETGIANSTFGGFASVGMSFDAYLEQFLKPVDGYYWEDPYVLGACIFSRDGAKEQWAGFDYRAREMMEPLVGYCHAIAGQRAQQGGNDDGGGDDGGGDDGGGDDGGSEQGLVELVEALTARVARLEAWARGLALG